MDDITFGASVWGGATESLHESLPSGPSQTTVLQPSSPDACVVDEFHDFGHAQNVCGEIDFGDFDNFGDAQTSLSSAQDFADDFAITQPPPDSRPWSPLSLDPVPSGPQLEAALDSIMEPIWANEDLADVTTDDGIRDVEGLAQILMTPTSRELYKTLVQTTPPTVPTTWTTSRIRRQYLIALGIPVNLDEMQPHTPSKLPPLKIHTRPMSAPPDRGRAQQSPQSGSATILSSRANSPQRGARRPSARAVSRPKLDMAAVEKLLQLDPETLPLQPLPVLERYLDDLKAQIANTSKVLTDVLQVREALQQDTETYNGLIAELAAEAQKNTRGMSRPGMQSKRNTTFG